MPHEVHEIGRIFAVVDRECRIHPDLLCVLTDQTRSDGVERARPCESARHQVCVRSKDLGANAPGGSGHLGCGPPRERHQKDSAGIDAADDQMCYPVREGVGLSGAGAGNDEQRANRDGRVTGEPELDGAPLIGVQLLKVGHGHGRGGSS